MFYKGTFTPTTTPTTTTTTTFINEPLAKFDVEMEEAPITRLEAQRALRLVRQYVEKNFANPQLLRQSDALDEAFWQDGQKKRKQSSLSDFFKPLT
uniref:Uncharacterized protein n=1 Tax=Ditylenchus dipsaci TaxID=166011 RepID=A0A915CNN5_9BILA